MTSVANPTDALSRLDAALAEAQLDDPFAPVAVIVPSPYARVQLRRAVGARRGLCNVSFRTWSELTGDLGRAAVAGPSRMPSPSVVDEALRQVLSAGSSSLGALAGSAAARSELVSVFYELWRSEPAVLRELIGHGERAQALVRTLRATEQHLGNHGFADPGRLLDAAALADVSTLGSVVRWFPRALRGRERAVLEHLENNAVPVRTIGAVPTGPRISVAASVPCSDPDTEVRATVRSVLEAAQGGTPLYSLAILHPPNERYRRLVHQQLVAAGVARCGPSPLALGNSATGRALLGLLRLADGRWSRGEVLSWLDCAPVTAGPGEPRPPVNRWDDVSARAGVIEGLDQWRPRLERFAAGGAPLDVHVAATAGETEAALALATFVDRLAGELTQPPGPWSGWAAWAAALLDRHLHPDDAAEPWPPEELVSAAAVRALLADLGGLDQVSTGCDLASFRHAVERELAARPIRDDTEMAAPASEGGSPEPPLPSARSLPGPVGWGVFVGTPAEARGMVFARVHLVGMADQFLPGPPLRASLLPQPDDAGPEWPSPARATEELFDDLAVVTALADRASATWPLVDPRTGRENTRSRWMPPIADAEPVSFASDVASDRSRRVPLSPADRLLGALARDGETPLEERAAVRFQPAGDGDPVPALRDSLVAGGLCGVGPHLRHDGWIGPSAPLLVEGELAPTSLEEYATCPRRYLFSRQLRVARAPRPEAIEEMEASQRGLLTHEVLARYVAERLEGAPRSLERLLGIGDERFAAAEAEGRCGPPVIAAVERSRLMSVLSLFFHDDVLDPVFVELAFGDQRTPEPEETTDPAVPAHPAVPGYGVTLEDGRPLRFRGRIDRIDRAEGATVVSDYKTGRGEDAKDLEEDPVGHGRKLQLVLYGLVAQREFAGTPVLARYWYTSLDRDTESVLCAINAETTARFEQVVGDIVTGIQSGAFPGIPGEETYRGRRPTFAHCAHCDYDRICPTDRDRRWARAENGEMAAPLARLIGEAPPAVGGLARRAALDLTTGAP